MADNYELNENGLKNTRHRNAILDILKVCECPMSADEIFIALKKLNIEINMSTIYRAVKSLTAKDMITKITIANEAKTLYEIKNIKHCHYLVCLGCKKVVPIEHCPIKEGYESDIKKETGFTVEGHNLEVYGYCSDCKDEK